MANLTWENAVTLPTGVVANFWKILELNVDMENNRSFVRYCGWIDESAANSKKEPVVFKQSPINFDGFDPTGAMANGLIQLVKASQV